MPRTVFTLQVDPSRIQAYRDAHAAVWPDMLAALRDTGWRDYTLHLRDDGLLIGVVDVDDLDAAVAAMDATEVNARWQAAMAPLFAGLDGGAPDAAMAPIPTIFHLEAQLEAAGLPTATATTTTAAGAADLPRDPAASTTSQETPR